MKHSTQTWRIDWNSSVLPWGTLQGITESAWLTVRRQVSAPRVRRGTVRLHFFNQPCQAPTAYCYPTIGRINVMLPSNYEKCRRAYHLTPYSYPGVPGAPELYLFDLEEIFLRLVAHEFRHLWTDAFDNRKFRPDHEVICDLAAERALTEFRACRGFFLC